MVTVSGNADCLKLAPHQLYFWPRLQNCRTCISYGFLETDGVLTPTICVRNNDNSSIVSIVFFGIMWLRLLTHHNAQLSRICNVHTLNCALKRIGFHHVKGTLQTISDSVPVLTRVLSAGYFPESLKNIAHMRIYYQLIAFFVIVILAAVTTDTMSGAWKTLV